MSDWAQINIDVNAALVSAGGSEPVVYQHVLGGTPVGDSFTISALRLHRLPEESGGAANFEEISVNPADFASPPAGGDWVTAWGTQYVVTLIRQPFVYGLINLVLAQRGSQA
jgi:hypothetical protein